MVKQAEFFGLTRDGRDSLSLIEREQFWSEYSGQGQHKLQQQVVQKLEE